MGLFDKRDRKRSDSFDSHVESVDLDKVPASQPVVMLDDAVPVERPRVATAPVPITAPPAASVPSIAAVSGPIRSPFVADSPAPPAPPDGYGIDKAIELMRSLPKENMELVVQVVKSSLASVGIQLSAIIEDAIRRQKDLRGRVEVLQSEIVELEQEIAARRDEIAKHEADHRETTTVRERLELAESKK
jgi:hypothetical protein